MKGSCNQDLTASPSQILLYLRLRHSLPPTCVTTLLVMQRSRVADPSTPSWNYPMLSEQMTKLGTAIAANVHTGVAGEREGLITAVFYWSDLFSLEPHNLSGNYLL